MKSIIIRIDGIKAIHLKKKDYGIESEIITNPKIEITYIGKDNKRIKLSNK